MSNWRKWVATAAASAILALGLGSCAAPAAPAPAAAPSAAPEAAAPAEGAAAAPEATKAAAPEAPESPLALVAPDAAGAFQSPLILEADLAPLQPGFDGSQGAARRELLISPDANAQALRLNLLRSYGPNPFVELASEVVRPNTVHPPRLIPMDDPFAGIRVFGAYQTMLSGFHDGKRTLPALVLTAPNAAVEITWPEPTTTVGVQLWGDKNDGCAHILVNGQELWIGDTRERNSLNFEGYVQIANLPPALHTVRVEPQVDARCPEAGDVTVVAFGWGAIGEGFKRYLPFVAR